MMKIDKRLKITISLSVMLLILVMIMVSTLGVSFFEIDPIASAYNDEVFYLKQIQGIWSGLAPSGSFGYNQQTAIVGTFGSWSVIIMYVYALIGFCFQSTVYAVFYTNLLMIIVAFAILIYNLNLKSEYHKIWLLMPFLNCIIFRHVYSGMTEALFYSLMMLVVLSLNRKEMKWKYIGFAIVIIGALMRPYMIIMLFPILFSQEKINWKSLGMVVMICLIVLVSYFGISYYFTAPYLSPLLRIGEIKALLNRYDLIETFIQLFNYVLANIDSTIWFIKESMINADMVGIIYLLHYLTLALFLVKIAVSIFLKKMVKLDLIMLICYVGAFLAIICLYAPYQGSRHVFIFTMMIWFYLLAQSNKYINSGLLILFVLFNFQFANNAYNKYPVKLDLKTEYIEDIRQIKVTNSDSYSNTLLYEFGVDNSLYHILYYLDEGLGVNLCLWENLADVNQDFKGKFVMLAVSSPSVDSYIQKFKLIASNDWYYLFDVE